MERLGFFDNEKKKITENNGLFIEPVYLHKKESSTIALEEFIGYIIYETKNISNLRELYTIISKEFFEGKILKDEAIKRLNCFYSVNYLFEKLKNKYSFEFDESTIIRGY